MNSASGPRGDYPLEGARRGHHERYGGGFEHLHEGGEYARRAARRDSPFVVGGDAFDDRRGDCALTSLSVANSIDDSIKTTESPSAPPARHT
jgi:hypothetical protein